MVGTWGTERLKIGVSLGLLLIYTFAPTRSEVPSNGVVRVSTGIKNEIYTSFKSENGEGSASGLNKVVNGPPNRKAKQDDGDDGDGGDDGGDDGGGGGGGGGGGAGGGAAGGGFGGANGALATLARLPQGATQFLTQLTQLSGAVNQQLNQTGNPTLPGFFFNGLQALLNQNTRTTPAPAPAAPPILPGQYPFLPPPYGVNPALLQNLNAGAGGAGYYPPPAGTTGGANYGQYPPVNPQLGGANGVGSQYAPNPSQGVGRPFGVGSNNGNYQPQVGGAETYPAQVSGGGFGGFGGGGGGGQTQGLQQQLGGGGLGGGLGGGTSNFGGFQQNQQLGGGSPNYGLQQQQITQGGGDIYGQSSSLDTEDYPKIQNIDRAPQKIQAPLESPPGGGSRTPEFVVKNETPGNYPKERPSNSRLKPYKLTSSPRPRPSLWQLYNNLESSSGNKNSLSGQSEANLPPDNTDDEIFHRTDDATTPQPSPKQSPPASFNQPTNSEFYPSSAYGDRGGDQQQNQDVTSPSQSGYPIVWTNSFYPAEDIVPTTSRRRRRRSTTPSPYY